METKFNFNSQICTDRFQSERLLALGLKKETADMVYTNASLPYYEEKFHVICKEYSQLNKEVNYEISPFSFIPAWSLGRLWELYWSNKVVSDCLFGCGKYMNPYAKMIAMIEYDIEDGTFNNDYLDK